MTIVVIGGKGRIGSKLTEHGHDAVAVDLRTGVNTLTGEGLVEALADAEVVDVNWQHPGRRAGGRRRTPRRAVGRWAPIVSPTAATCEPSRPGEAGPKLLGPVLDRPRDAVLRIRRVHRRRRHRRRHGPPAGGAHPAHAADEVARAVARVAVGAPVNSIVEVGGPKPYPFDKLIRKGLSASNEPRHVVADSDARYFGTKLSETGLLPGEDAQLGETRFEDWLSAEVRTPSA